MLELLMTKWEIEILWVIFITYLQSTLAAEKEKEQGEEMYKIQRF